MSRLITPRPGRLAPSRIQRVRGLTLVELLVALTLGSLVVLAAVAALSLSRSGFSSVDASAQLRDDGRFASSIMRRIALQSGFLDLDYSSNVAGNDFKVGSGGSADVEPPVKAFNNAKYNQNLVTGASNNVSAQGINKSDLLILRFQPGSARKTASTTVGDEAMITCNGSRVDYQPTGGTDRVVNAFYIAMSQGEPSLMCASSTSGGGWLTEPLIQGVETMQLLFGVDGVTPGAPPSASSPPDSVPERYLRADQLKIPGTPPDPNANWKRVRSIRVGLVLRGAPGSAQGKTPAQYPLGAQGVMDTSDDAGSVFLEQTDGRLRQTVTFTIHLRNRQDLM